MASAEKFKTIDEYIRSFPSEVSGVLQTLRETIKEEAPEAEETIKYGMPTFTYRGNLVYFSAWKSRLRNWPTTKRRARGRSSFRSISRCHCP